MQLPENYIIEQRNVKHPRIRVSENNLVRIIIPDTFTQDDLTALIRKKEKWIEKTLKRFDERCKKIVLHRNQILYLGNRYTYYFDETYKRKVIVNHTHKTIRAKRDLLDPVIQEKWYKSQARKLIHHKVEAYAEKYSFKYNKVFLRSQRTKWGNCSKKKNLSFNWRLIKAPEFVIDYLVIHELVHTEIMNHSAKFWRRVKSLYPGSREAIKWLDKYGNDL